jgi:murein DD-endopeptidase MepM/ murein hydrolase activator NlpD
MTPQRRGVTVVIQRDGATRSRTFRVPLWTLRLATAVGSAVVVAVVLLGLLYGPVLRAAARVPQLERQIARLEADNAKVRQLSAALDSAELRYSQVRQMIGGDIIRDQLEIATTLPLAPTLRARLPSSTALPSSGVTVPRQWPLDEQGYVTRGQVASGTGDEAHPGIDIAVPTGSLVRAAGGATVHQVGEDPEYGFFVLLDHADDYQSMYGHLSRILVAVGRSVAPGEVIGLSGNSGRSTAPHLHFEIRQRGVSLDPRSMVKEGG